MTLDFQIPLSSSNNDRGKTSSRNRGIRNANKSRTSQCRRGLFDRFKHALCRQSGNAVGAKPGEPITRIVERAHQCRRFRVHVGPTAMARAIPDLQLGK